MNSSKRSFARLFLPGQSIASMFFIVYVMLPNISLLPNTPNSQLLSSHEHYLRNLAQLYPSEDDISDRNKAKKKTRGVEQVVSKINFGKRKKKTNKSNKDEFYENELNDVQENIEEDEKQLSEEEINELINSLELYPQKSDIRNVWWQVCGNEENKFYDIINHFLTLYDEIKHKYKVRKDTFRKNIWGYFDEVAKTQLPKKENSFEKLLYDLTREKSITKDEFRVLTEQYKSACTELREELFSMCQVEIAQVMMQLPWWKGY
ncbi:hypothetical protein PCYB_001070 [Plasmodium cynomolgi strain B]|uniref:Plasmodium RESA N-terminal domain-containing protein n=1 Tax=Plasmodium cynomolgi (strain B) TaxID=1120755 RepID=K6UZE9_PLACD|nr:hypothetical protein PCYB_001070 [Plasmodium cynomolgi strain B]GAB69359.1 hypothetical protein PCYB_001070 [Plasmodium cynomolgi strain B]